MYRDIQQWKKIRKRILVEGVSRARISRETGISRNTIKRILHHPLPVPYMRPKRSCARVAENTDGCKISRDHRPEACVAVYNTLRTLNREQAIEFLRAVLGGDHDGPTRNGIRDAIARAAAAASLVSAPSGPEKLRLEAREWMRQVQQGRIASNELEAQLSGLSDLPLLIEKLRAGSSIDRSKAMTILSKKRGFSSRLISSHLGLSRNTCRKYVGLYSLGGSKALFLRYKSSKPKSDSELFIKAVFALLHEPPSNFGINRTSWKLVDLSRVLGEKGLPACRQTISGIISAAGYQFRKARIALTSTDPQYKEKLEHIQKILGNLTEDEAFFSIDEFGPFAVKMKPGRMLTPPGEQRIVQQFQKSKGCLIMTAALELSSNQVAHFYSKKKNTTEMIRMTELLVQQYCSKRKIYLSWDAASWHISKKLMEAIKLNNDQVQKHGGPIVDTAPLPASAQFLNVIESVFSGMARAIIHNSDYPGLIEAKSAIDRYFEERNAHFRAHPRRAGKIIWGKERVPSSFSESNNCKDPRYR